MRADSMRADSMRTQALAANSFQPMAATLPICLNITAHVDHRFGGLTTSLPPFCEALEATGRYRSDLAAFCAPDEVYSGSATPQIFPLAVSAGPWTPLFASDWKA